MWVIWMIIHFELLELLYISQLMDCLKCGLFWKFHKVDQKLFATVPVCPSRGRHYKMKSAPQFNLLMLFLKTCLKVGLMCTTNFAGCIFFSIFCPLDVGCVSENTEKYPLQC